MEYRCNMGCLMTSKDRGKPFPICDHYKDCNRENKLKVNKVNYLDFTDVSSTSTSDKHTINTYKVLDTSSNTNIESNDVDSISLSNLSNENPSSDDDLSLISYPNYNMNNEEIEESAPEFDTISLCSSFHRVEKTIHSYSEKCAVLLCNENIRKQFSKLFFIDFPKHNKELCNIWWKICGRHGKFDPTSKLCSIHFDANNLIHIKVKQVGQVYVKTVLKKNVIPTRYLLSQEYLKFVNKRKKINSRFLSKQLLHDSQAKYNKPSIEYNLTDILNDNDIDKSQSKQNNTSSLMKQYLESFAKEITHVEHDETEFILKANESNFKNVPENITNYIISDNTSLTKYTSMLPEISQRELQNNFEGIPQSIIHCEEFTECYDKMGPSNCDQHCQFICHYSIPSYERKEIYKEFQSFNMTEQNCKITQLVLFPKNKNNINLFESCPSYHLIVNKKFVKVCRTFFLNTLGLTENRLNAVLKPDSYSWYSDSNRGLKAMKQPTFVDEPIFMTDFMKESSKLLEKDFNLYEPDSDSEVNLESVPSEEYEKVILYMKSIPKFFSTYQQSEESETKILMTSLRVEYLYKKYYENYIKNKISLPLTSHQFKKIYNQYMKTFLKTV